MIKQNDPRRWKERADGSMVREDKGAMANLSPSVMMREIPHHDIPIDPSVPGDLQGVGLPGYSGMTEVFFGAVKEKGRLK
jgi:hypothetical protein